jgi:hypothetical protein
MNSSLVKQAIKTKVSEVSSANRGVNMDIGQIRCLGERQ